MLSKSNTSVKFVRVALLLLAVALALLWTVTVVYAALYVIHTDDNSITDWTSQGIPVFLTDPSGDAIPVPITGTARADEDLINAWVASGNTTSGGHVSRLFFLAQTAGNPALDQENRQVVASIDCNHDGVDQTALDTLIIYARATDIVWVVRGDLNSGASLDDDTHDLGQRIGDYLEWSVPVGYLAPNPLLNGGSDCRGTVNIRFATASFILDTVTQTWSGVAIDTTDLAGWNVPTAIMTQNFRAVSAAGLSPISASVISLIVVAGAGIIALIWHDKFWKRVE